jgi:hypothetical protein
MNNWIDRVLKAYRPLYLRGLLMDGQYRLPEISKEPPASGKRAVTVRPAFQPGRRKVLVATAATAAAGLCAATGLPGSIESTAKPVEAPTAAKRRA